jgi:hypothetical protein
MEILVKNGGKLHFSGQKARQTRFSLYRDMRSAKLNAMRCGLCHQDVPKLVESHIVPKAMMRHNQPQGSAHPFLVVSTEAHHYVKRSRTGLYSRIVCPQCEQSFQRSDDALLNLLRSLPTATRLRDPQGHPAAITFPNADVELIHRGILTTLFRAHLSKDDGYHKLNVSPFEELIRQLLLGTSSTLNAGHDVVLRVVETPAGALTPNPFRQPLDGIDVCTIYFPYITAYIKLDRRPFSRVFESVRLREGSPIMAVWRPEVSKSELEVIRSGITTHWSTIEKYLVPSPLNRNRNVTLD